MTNYSKDKLYDIMNTTQLNYANMIKRLSQKKQFSDMILIYYSIALIIYSLTVKFFPQYYNSDLSSYFSIIVSIVVLVYSLINGNAHYGTRLGKAEQVLNSVKNIKRELTDENLTEKKQDYDFIMTTAEYRSDIDFFRTLKQKCCEKNIKWYLYKKEYKAHNDDDDFVKLNNYLSEINPFLQEIKILLEYFMNLLLLIIPIIILVICICVKI